MSQYDLESLVAERENDACIKALEAAQQECEQDLQAMEVLVQDTYDRLGKLTSFQVFVANHRCARQRGLPHTQVGVYYPNGDRVQFLSGYRVAWTEDDVPQSVEGELTTAEVEKINQMAMKKARAICNQ